MWAEDDLDPGEPCLESYTEPSNGKVYLMYHGTSRFAAQQIKKSGFKPSAGGTLGPGVYLSRDLDKARRYPLHLSEHERVVLRVFVNVGRVKAIGCQGHPMQTTWHSHGYDTAWCPPKCGMTRSGLEENCVWDPNRIQVIDEICLKTSSAAVIQDTSSDFIMWAEDDLDPGEPCLESYTEPSNGKVYLMYHGTSRFAAQQIKKSGFKPSARGTLGPGVYLSRDLDKARRYPLHLSEHERVVLRVFVNVGRVKAIGCQGHPMQTTWHSHGYDTAWCPPKCGMTRSGLEENCVWDPNRIQVIDEICLKTSSAAVIQDTSSDFIMWAEDDLDPGEPCLESYTEPSNGKVYLMYHGTSRPAAQQIMRSGFRPSKDGMLGRGVYLSRDLKKASRYPLELPERERVVLRVRVNVGQVKKIDRQHHPMQRTWHSHGYDTAWCPPKCGMVPSGLEEDCVWDPNRIQTSSAAVIQYTSSDFIMWAEDDLDPGEPCLESYTEPSNGKVYLMYHGTSRPAAQQIKKSGFKPSAGGTLGPGVYLSRDLDKARRYPLHLSEHERVVLRVFVNVGRVKAIGCQGHPMQTTWHSHGYDTAWCPPKCGMTRSGLEENCVWDPNRIQVIDEICLKTSSAAVIQYTSSDFIMWAEDDLDPGEPCLESYTEPSNGKVYLMYHGTSRPAAQQIMRSGFRPSKDGMLGRGVYLSRDLKKASRYPLELPERERVVLRVRVNVGQVKKIDRQHHPMQRTWHSHGYDTAWCPPKCGMVPSGLEEDCVWDPNRIQTSSAAVIQDTSSDFIMWAEDDLDPGEPCLESYTEPSNGKVYLMYHGTSRFAAQQIKKSGFKPSAGGTLGPGVYLSRDLDKARRYPLHLSEHERVVLRVFVNVGRVKAIGCQGHPMQTTWHSHGYDTAWCPPKCGMTRSGLEENCVWDPNRIQVIDEICLKTSSAAVIQYTSSDFIMWAEDDLDPGEPCLESYTEPSNGKVYLMYHGTSRFAAQQIKKSGFKPSAGGTLGPGVYLSRDLDKARRYPLHLSEHERVVLRVFVNVGRVKAIGCQGHPMQTTWHSHGYDTAWCPPKCGMTRSGLEENCVWDPNRIQVIDEICLKTSSAAVIQDTSSDFIMWAEDDLDPGVPCLESYPEPNDGKVYVMYHGTTKSAAKKIMRSGFKPSAGGLLGPGVYLSRDLNKAIRYPLNLPEHERVVLRVQVNVGRVKRIDRQRHPLQMIWHRHGYDSAWCPPNCAMVPSGLEDWCVWDPNRIQVIDALRSNASASSCGLL